MIKVTSVKKRAGFTLVEAMVALTVVAIAFLGMAGVMIRAMQVQRVRDHLDVSVRLAKSKAGQLAQVSFNVLGTGGTGSTQEVYGAPDEDVVSIGPLNKRGEKDSGGTLGPFPYTNSFVVCKDDADGGSDAASESGDPCGNVSSTRPDELTCDTAETEAGQALVKVLTTFLDRSGRCHKMTFQQSIIDFE